MTTDNVSQATEAVRQLIRRRFPASRLTRLTPAEVADLGRAYRGAPSDYVAFRQRVGWGSIGEWRFMVYATPMLFAEVFPDITDPTCAAVVLVGDDFAGTHAAFDTSTTPWRFVVVEHTRPADLSSGTDDNFTAFLVAELEA